MKKILIIENDPEINQLLALMLKEPGCEVIQWVEYQSLHEIVELKPDLILLDHKLDGILGANICLVIKNNPLTKMIPVILMSGIIDLQKIAGDSCADDFIIKPFDLVELQRKVKRLQP